MEQGMQHPGGWLLEAMEGVGTSSNSGEVALALTGGWSPDFMCCANMSTCPNLRCLKSISIYSFISNTFFYPHYETCYPLLRGSRWSLFCPQHQIIITLRDNCQVLVETHLPTSNPQLAGSMLVGMVYLIYLPKIHRAPRASSFLYLDWKHISAWDVKIVKSAVNLKCGPVGIFTSPCGHGSDHVVLRLAGVACSSNMSPKGSSHNPNWVGTYESSAAAVFFKDWFHYFLLCRSLQASCHPPLGSSSQRGAGKLQKN